MYTRKITIQGEGRAILVNGFLEFSLVDEVLRQDLVNPSRVACQSEFLGAGGGKAQVGLPEREEEVRVLRILFDYRSQDRYGLFFLAERQVISRQVGARQFAVRNI